ncbi:Equilibrative nucleoside transporter [Sergentomyia squamirostris]
MERSNAQHEDADTTGDFRNTYEPLSSTRRHYEPSESPDTETGPPKDRKHVVYLALLTAGIGFVLPYNSFIIAADYWQGRFPGRSVALDMSMTYILVAFATVLLNNVFLSLVPFKIRVQFGYAISFTTLVFVALCEVAWHMFAATTAYSVNLAAVSLVAVGCTVQQSSFYGFASMLPKQYTQAVMAGESLAGFLVSSNRVVTKLLIENNRLSTMIFFLTSSVYIGISYVLHTVTVHSPFVRYHVKACAKIILQPYEARQSDSIDGGDSAKYGVLTLDPSSPTQPAPALSFSNPVYELSNPTAGESSLDAALSDGGSPAPPPTNEPSVAFKVEHVLTPGGCSRGRLGDFRSGLEARWRVAHAIYPYMVCIALAYCVTLSLYPGIESEIISCSLRSWMPVLLMFTFNFADVLGKILAAVPYAWSRRQLTLMSGLRTLLVPLLLLTCTPRERPIISGETPAFFFTAALGLSNGLAGSLPMILAPAKVPASLKEVSGNMMTLSYQVGLTAGSLLGYMFDSILGPQLQHPCPVYPYIPSSPVINTTTMATTTSSTSTLVTTTMVAALNTTQKLLTTVATNFTTAANEVLPDEMPHIFSIASTAFYNSTQLLNNTSYELSDIVNN